MGVNYEKLKQHLELVPVGGNPLQTVNNFVKEYLDPKPENYMDYRYEHILRVARWGKVIAEAEGWDAEPLIIGCLMHDVSYPDCVAAGTSDDHPQASAIIAKALLEKIGYDPVKTATICKGIAYHDRWNDFPEDMTAFELSIRDADDLDRFDMMRNIKSLRADVGDFRVGEILAACKAAMAVIDGWEDHICGTATAAKLWKQQLQVRREMYQRTIRQSEYTNEMDAYLASLE